MITFGRGHTREQHPVAPSEDLLGQVPMVAWTTDAAGVVHHTTPELHAYVGTDDGGPPPGGWLELIHPDDRPAVQRTWRAAVASGQSWAGEPRIRRGDDGMYRWHRAVAHPVHDPDGAVVSWVGAATDVHDLRTSETEARSRSARLQTILDLEPECVKLVASGGTLLEMNPAGLAMVQVDEASAIVGQRVIDLIHPEDRAAFQELHKQVSSGRGPGRLEFRVVGREGRVRWVESTSVGVEIPVGSSPLAVLSVTRDVTDRRRAEAFLMAESRMLEQLTSRADLPSLLDAVAVALDEAFGATSSVVLVDPDGRHLRHGAGPGLPQRFLEAIDGAEVGPRAGSCGTAVHRKARVVVSDIDTDPLWDDHRELALSCGLRSCWATPVLDGQGNVVASLAEYHAVPHEPDALELQLSDRAASLLGLAIDRIRGDEALQRSNAMLTMASDLARLGWWTIDLEGMELTGSDLLGEIHGLPPGQTPGLEDLVLLYAPEERARVEAAVTECATNGTPYSMELKVLHPSGEERWVRGEGRAVFDAAGRVVAIEGSSQDLTEQHRSAEAIRLMEAQLQQAQRLEAVGQLTGGVAHDFNNLLTVILGNADLLHDAIDDTDLQALVEATTTAARRGADLTQRMLAFARQQPLHPTAVDVPRLVNGLREMLTRTLAGGVELEVRTDADVRPALADPPQLEAAILNLCLNARDAMPDGGQLQVAVDAVPVDTLPRLPGEPADPTDGCWVRVAVTDNGAGMSSDVLERVFDPFFTTKPVGQGTGLGLSMVYGFVQQSAGRVRVASEPGLGTIFEIYLPSVAAEGVVDNDDAAPPGHRSRLPGGTERILLVEDDDLVRSTVARQLQRLGYQVCETDGPASALEALRSGATVDLLLTDIVMPGGTDGRQLAERAAAMRPGLRVLFTSGYTEHALLDDGRMAPSHCLLPKPYAPADLAHVVRDVLDRPPPAR